MNDETEKLLFDVVIIGLNYLIERNISMQEVSELQKIRAAQGNKITVADLNALAQGSQEAIDSIKAGSTGLYSE